MSGAVGSANNSAGVTSSSGRFSVRRAKSTSARSRTGYAPGIPSTSNSSDNRETSNRELDTPDLSQLFNQDGETTEQDQPENQQQGQPENQQQGQPVAQQQVHPVAQQQVQPENQQQGQPVAQQQVHPGAQQQVQTGTRQQVHPGARQQVHPGARQQVQPHPPVVPMYDSDEPEEPDQNRQGEQEVIDSHVPVIKSSNVSVADLGIAVPGESKCKELVEKFIDFDDAFVKLAQISAAMGNKAVDPLSLHGYRTKFGTIVKKITSLKIQLAQAEQFQAWYVSALKHIDAASLINDYLAIAKKNNVTMNKQRNRIDDHFDEYPSKRQRRA